MNDEVEMCNTNTQNNNNTNHANDIRIITSMRILHTCLSRIKDALYTKHYIPSNSPEFPVNLYYNEGRILLVRSIGGVYQARHGPS